LRAASGDLPQQPIATFACPAPRIRDPVDLPRLLVAATAGRSYETRVLEPGESFESAVAAIDG
jgi:hypothetical protein